MKDVESNDAARDRSGLGEPIREASIAMDKDDDDLIYDHTHFPRDKVRRGYFRYYYGPT
jgi:hypothetical protein